VTTPPPGTPARILVVDDEPEIVALVAYHLTRAGYQLSTAGTGPDAVRMAREERPALVVLDLMLPGMSGYDVLEVLRRDAVTNDVPVLMLTARRDEEDRVRGLALGADDYVTKPFSPRELVLRVGAILRRAKGESATHVTVVGPIRIDRDRHEVSVDGEPAELTPIEYKLLTLLAQRRGRLQDRAELLEQVWDASPDVQTRTVDMHVQRLRAKLGRAGDLIETVRGFGYRIRGDAPANRSSTSGDQGS
jgi:two-component system phosphate regulon response regulator PhoB